MYNFSIQDYYVPLVMMVYAINPQSAKFLKVHLEMQWVDLWQLL